MTDHLHLPLNPTFRFIHEPLGTTIRNDWQRFVAREAELDELAVRILLSEGGAFLVTGYRGVGKTTFVNRVVSEIDRLIPKALPLIGPTEIVDIYLNLARPMGSTELMHHILRSLYNRLSEKGILKKIDRKLRQDLELAFTRTTVSLGYKTSDQSEQSIGLEDAVIAIPYLNLSPKLSFNSKRVRGLNRELTYLAYDDRSAEYDLIQIARSLSNGYTLRFSYLRELIRHLRKQNSQRVALKIIFIFDELDKIDEGRSFENGSVLDQILSNLKNLFTTSGLTFVFIAGKDLHEHWLEDIGRGNSIYESVFTYVKYLPALWTHVDRICDPLLNSYFVKIADDTPEVIAYSNFKKFLAFKGRGMPRRILRGFNDQVRWDGEKSYLAFSRDDVRRFHFYAGLYDVLQENEEQLLDKLRDDSATERIDQQKLALHYLSDWILQRGLSIFTAEEAIAASRQLNRLIAPSEHVAPEVINSLIKILEANDYIEGVTNAHSNVYLLGHPPAAMKGYHVVRRRLVEMGNLLGIFEREAQSLFASQWTDISDKRFQVIELIAQGGMSKIYKAIDRRTGGTVAIKQPAWSMRSNPQFLELFRREAEILASLQHPNIVRFYDLEISTEQISIIMEFVEGVLLSELINQNLLDNIDNIIQLSYVLLQTIEYIHQRGILWRDPKPSNIMLTYDGRLILIDFGISNYISSTENKTGIVGTPHYMSPEQARGDLLDERSDLYSIGVVLYQMVTGKLPFVADTAASILSKILNEPVPLPSTFVQIPSEFEEVILKCLERDPVKRYQSATEVLAALPIASASNNFALLAQSILDVKQQAFAREDKATEQDDKFLAGTQSFELLGTLALSTQYLSTPDLITKPRLVLTSTSNISVFILDKARLSLGRSMNNDIVLDDFDTSRYHAILTKDKDIFQIEDLNSANGTFVNGDRIITPTNLKNDDQIKVGNSVLVYVATNANETIYYKEVN